MTGFAKRTFYAALAGWIAIDVYMSAVYVAFGSTPLRLFQWDASNALGRAAYGGGWASAALGLVLDFIVSGVWAAIAVYAMTRLAPAREHPVLFGTLYGAFVMYVMIWLVVPLGHARQAPKTLENMLVILFGHIAFFGVPVTVAAEQTGPRRRCRR